jgi:hypothetical protein
MTSSESPVAGLPTRPAMGTTLPPHGTLSRHKSHSCKCEPCRKAGREYMSRRYRLIAYGRWQPYVDAAPVRAHIRMLCTYGIGIPQTRQLSGVSNGSISRLLYGRGERGPSRRVRTQTADRILAIKPSLDAAAPSALVDGTGTQRRLQALVAVGWPQKELARRLGLDRNTVNDQVNLTTPAYGSTARAVRDLYDELWNVDPLQTGVGKRWVFEAKALAKARGWVPPGAWDDDYIDSPAAVPDVGEHVAQYVSLTEDAEWLMASQGYTQELAAHRLGVTRAHLARAMSYARRKEAAA